MACCGKPIKGIGAFCKSCGNLYDSKPSPIASNMAQFAPPKPAAFKPSTSAPQPSNPATSSAPQSSMGYGKQQAFKPAVPSTPDQALASTTQEVRRCIKCQKKYFERVLGDRCTEIKGNHPCGGGLITCKKVLHLKEAQTTEMPEKWPVCCYRGELKEGRKPIDILNNGLTSKEWDIETKSGENKNVAANILYTLATKGMISSKNEEAKDLEAVVKAWFVEPASIDKKYFISTGEDIAHAFDQGDFFYKIRLDAMERYGLKSRKWDDLTYDHVEIPYLNLKNIKDDVLIWTDNTELTNCNHIFLKHRTVHRNEPLFVSNIPSMFLEIRTGYKEILYKEGGKTKLLPMFKALIATTALQSKEFMDPTSAEAQRLLKDYKIWDVMYI